MSETTTPAPKPNPVAERIAAAKKAQTELEAKRAELKKNIGKTFTNGENEATVVSFDVAIAGDSFWINHGNKFVNKLVLAETFLKDYKPKE